MEALKGNVIGGSGPGVAGGSSNEMKVFQDYTLTPPTLEEVFMQVSKESGSNVGGV